MEGEYQRVFKNIDIKYYWMYKNRRRISTGVQEYRHQILVNVQKMNNNCLHSSLIMQNENGINCNIVIGQ